MRRTVEGTKYDGEAFLMPQFSSATPAVDSRISSQGQRGLAVWFADPSVRERNGTECKERVDAR